jgi:aryl-alcohol dehydrogenase-like predicted oxidoreductase
METMRLGKTNLQVTKLGFGGIPIQRLSEEGAIEVEIGRASCRERVFRAV